MKEQRGGKPIASRLPIQSTWFSTLFYQSPIAMSVTRLDDGTFVEVNDPFCKLTGWRREELIGRTAVDLGFYSDAQERRDLLGVFVEEGELRRREHPFRTRQGERRDALRYSELLAYGAENYVLSQIIDITDRKRAEAALRKSEQTLHAIFDNTHQSFVLVDRDRRILAYNRVANERSRLLVGVDLQEGDRFDRYLAPEAAASILANIERALDGEYHVSQRPLTGQDGQHRWYEAHYDPIRSEDGEITGVFFSVLDITERKSLEQTLHESEIKLQAIFENSLQSMMLADRDYQVRMFNQVANERSERLLGYPIQEGNSIERYIREEHRAGVLVNLQRALEGTPTSDELRVQDPEGHEHWFDVHYSPVRDDGDHVIGVFNTLTDITERKRVERDIDRRLKELETVHLVSERLQSLRSLEELAEVVIGVLERTLDYEYSGLFLLNDEGRLVPFALGDWQHRSRLSPEYRSALATEELRIGRGIVGWVAEHGESVRCGDVQRDPRYDPILPEINSELCVPLVTDGNIVGVVNVEARKPNAYTESDQRVLEIIAAQIAVSIQNAQLLEQAESARDRVTTLSQQLMQAQEAERRSIATELHDEIGQSLTAIKLLLEASDSRMDDSEDGPVGPVARARDLTDDLIDQVRRLSLDLRPAMLDDLGLWPTLKWHIERFETNTGIKVDLMEGSFDGQRLPTDVETTAYRIVQEAFTNVARHAQTDRVQLRMDLDGAGLHIEIRDRGVGFHAPTRASERTSTGLTGMRERAQLLGGCLEIHSSRGVGTRLSCHLPMCARGQEGPLDDDRDRG